jgi:branched-chain amino acid transport system substrate-binding protein
LAIAHCVPAVEPADTKASAAPPFFRLRETTLGYQGPSDDFTNLTEIKIGWFGPTNLDDPLTGDSWWAANLAIREANDHFGRPGKSSFSCLTIRLIPRWAVDAWGTGVSQLTRMVYDEQPLALLGSVDSTTTHLAEQVVAKANLPLVSPIATDKSVTLAGVSWMFSCAPGDDAIARVLGEAIQAEFGSSSDRIVLLATTDHESRMTAREVVRELARRGRRPDFRYDVPPGAADTTRQLQAAAEAKPAVVLIIAGAEDAAQLARTVRDRLGQVVVFGSHSLARRRFLALAGSAAEGIRFPLLFAPDSTDAEAVRFVARFTSEHNHPPDYTAALTYDATRLLIAAIHRAGPNRARIRETLVQLSPWPGIAGPIQFDGTGQILRTNLCMATFRGGAIARRPHNLNQKVTTNNTAKR